MTNVETVRAIYDAFGRGDVAAILQHLAEDVVWEYGVNSTDVPWLQPRSGRDQVPAFFQALSALAIERFVPKEILADGDLVVALIDLEATVRATGQRIVEEDEVHIWRFRNGRVASFRHRADTHQHVQSLRGATVQ